MKMTSPNDLVAMISDEQWERVKGKGSLSSAPRVEPQWVEPPEPTATADTSPDQNATTGDGTKKEADKSREDGGTTPKLPNIKSRIYRLGDFIDTDALAPAQSFAFIYSRNQPSLGLLGLAIADPAFYEAVDRGGEALEIEIDLVADVVRLGAGGGGGSANGGDGSRQEFPFELSQMEKRLTELGGVAPAFNKFGKQIFDALTSGSRGVQKSLKEAHGAGSSLAW